MIDNNCGLEEVDFFLIKKVWETLSWQTNIQLQVKLSKNFHMLLCVFTTLKEHHVKYGHVSEVTADNLNVLN